VTTPFQPDRAAAAIAAARRVLVTGGGLAAEAAVRACDLAEAIGAAVDFGGLDTAQAAGPTIVRIGEVTADPEELRDRADLVVFWFCDPAADFLRRFVTPATAAGRSRHTIAVGEVAVATAAADDLRLQVAATDAVDLARLLHAAVAGRAIRPPPALVAASAALNAGFDAAGCVAFVTHHRDPVGLEPWSLVGLVRALAHVRPAFEVPVVPAGVATAVCTWRCGAAGAIARADRGGGEFRPAECDAVRLIARSEVDCVVAVGPLAETVEAALADRGDAVTVIRIGGDDAAVRSRLGALISAVGARDTAGVAP
jgi:formylmethanofuran dehydrogenase subunit B